MARKRQAQKAATGGAGGGPGLNGVVYWEPHLVGVPINGLKPTREGRAKGESARGKRTAVCNAKGKGPPRDQRGKGNGARANVCLGNTKPNTLSFGKPGCGAGDIR